jgi:hypothetical protein
MLDTSDLPKSWLRAILLTPLRKQPVIRSIAETPLD